jgi:excisionase family DNA binding protein
MFSGMPKQSSKSFTRSKDSPPYDLTDWPFRGPCTKAEVAETVRTTKRFLEAEVSRGHLRAVHIGERSVRFLPSDVIAWLNSRPVSRFEEEAAK